MGSGPDAKRMWKLAARYSAVGIEMAASLAIGTLGGQWLDGKLDTSPWLFYSGLLVGLGAAVKAVWRTVKNTKLEDL